MIEQLEQMQAADGSPVRKEKPRYDVPAFCQVLMFQADICAYGFLYIRNTEGWP